MIKEVKMFTVSCDCCGIVFEDQHSGIVAWNDPDDVVYQAENSDWIKCDDIYSGGHYCPNCYEVDDNDNIKIGPKS